MVSSRDLTFISIVLFAVLFTLDAWTTEIGLIMGAKEEAPFASAIISSFGIQGFMALKVSISVAALVVGLGYFVEWRRLGYIFRWTYEIASMSLAGSALIPVVHNMILLGFL